MYKLLTIPLFAFLLLACSSKHKKDNIKDVNWESRKVSIPKDSLNNGKTYLAVYSHIYSRSQHQQHNLTATVSLRNINVQDTVYVNSAKYYNTKGEEIRTYFDYPIYIAPLETIEIIIDELDESGGSGANFIFDWSKNENINSPLFECVMISTSGQQGVSFTTKGIQVK